MQNNKFQTTQNNYFLTITTPLFHFPNWQTFSPAFHKKDLIINSFEPKFSLRNPRNPLWSSNSPLRRTECCSCTPGSLRPWFRCRWRWRWFPCPAGQQCGTGTSSPPASCSRCTTYNTQLSMSYFLFPPLVFLKLHPVFHLLSLSPCTSFSPLISLSSDLSPFSHSCLLQRFFSGNKWFRVNE